MTVTPLRVERLIMKEEVDVICPKQLLRESTEAFNLPSSSLSASDLVRLFGDPIHYQRAPADERLWNLNTMMAQRNALPLFTTQAKTRLKITSTCHAAF